MLSERSKAARSALWSAVEKGGLVAVSLVSLVVYSRFLSASDFGLFSIVLSLVELGVLLVSMLFHDALVQKEEVTPLHFDTAFTATMALSALLFVAALVFAPLFARATDSPDAARLLPWTALSVPLTAWTATIVAQQRRALSFRALALRSLVGRSAGGGSELCWWPGERATGAWSRSRYW